MSSPQTAVLSPELLATQGRWREAKGAEKGEIYAHDFAPAFLDAFRALPLHGAPPDLPRPRALVSVLGLSWQPIALMAAWTRPEHLLLLGTKESFARQEGTSEAPLERILRLSGLSFDAVDRVVLPDPGEIEIYREVRRFVDAHGLEPRTVYVDPTGGKKSMSASAALAAFLLGAPLVYVDYCEYQGRIPVAGTEYPRLLSNPLQVFGDQELGLVAAAFDRGDYGEAASRAESLARRLYEPRQAEMYAALARGYGAWDAFRFGDVRAELEGALDRLRRFGRQAGWPGVDRLETAIERNLGALDEVVAAAQLDPPPTVAAGLPLVLNHLAAARRAHATGRSAVALLLAYATVERFVDLCLRVDFGLDDEKPDYALVVDIVQERRKRYDAVGRKLVGKNLYRPRDLAGPLMFTNGIQLLATLEPDRFRDEDLGRLKGLANRRNQCELEHGTRPADPENVAQHLRSVASILAHTMGGEQALEERLAHYAFPKLS